MKIYHVPNSANCRKVIATAAHVGIPYESHVVNFAAGELASPQFRAINPNGKVPVLVDGDTTLWESNAIMAYLAAQTDSSLWPDSNARYDIMRWQTWEAAHWQGQAIGPVAFERMLRPMLGLGEPDAGVIEAGVAAFRKLAGVLDDHLEGRSWLVGEGLTLADFAVGSQATIARVADLPLGDYPHVLRWMDALDEVPAWRDTAPSFG